MTLESLKTGALSSMGCSRDFGSSRRVFACVALAASCLALGASACGDGDDRQAASFARDAGDASIAPPAAVDAASDSEPDAPLGCTDPPSGTASAVCVTITSEPIAFIAGNPARDGKGRLWVQVFSADNPDPAPDGSDPTALTMPVSLPNGDVGEVDLSQPIAPIRFEIPLGAAPQVYVRALFVDDAAALGRWSPGWWLGGYTIEQDGQVENPALSLSLIDPGQTTSVAVKLLAVRHVTMTITRKAGVLPVGNGQGPISFLLWKQHAPTYWEDIFGWGSVGCGDVAGDGGVVVEGLVVGKGPRWVSPELNDFYTVEDPANGDLGAMLAVEKTDAGLETFAPQNMISYPDDAYEIVAHAELTMRNPPPPDGGVDMILCDGDQVADAGAFE